MTPLSSLIWPSFLAGEARRRTPLALPRPVFVAPPRAALDEPPVPALLVAWLYRTTSAEPTHAEVRLPNGEVAHRDPAWIRPRPHLAVVGGRGA